MEGLKYDRKLKRYTSQAERDDILAAQKAYISGNREKRKPLSQEIKDKISRANAGKKRTSAQRSRISQSLQGRTLSKDHRLKISKILKERDVGQKQMEGLFLAKKGVVLPSLRDRLIREDQESIQKLKSDPFK